MSDESMKLDPARLKLQRESRGWTQEQLAEIAGLSARTVQRVETTGKAAPETGMALAAVLDCPLSELSERSAPQQDAPIAGPGPGGALAGLRPWLVLALLAAILGLLQGSFGYRIGKDLAERENRRDCAGTECD